MDDEEGCVGCGWVKEVWKGVALYPWPPTKYV